MILHVQAIIDEIVVSLLYPVIGRDWPTGGRDWPAIIDDPKHRMNVSKNWWVYKPLLV